jgi:hypothetical protein
MSQAFCSLIVRAFSSAMRVPGCKFAGASMMCARGSADGAGRFLWPLAPRAFRTLLARRAVRFATLAVYGNLMKRPNAALYSGNFSRSSTW